MSLLSYFSNVEAYWLPVPLRIGCRSDIGRGVSHPGVVGSHTSGGGVVLPCAASTVPNSHNPELWFFLWCVPEDRGVCAAVRPGFRAVQFGCVAGGARAFFGASGDRGKRMVRCRGGVSVPGCCGVLSVLGCECVLVRTVSVPVLSTVELPMFFQGCGGFCLLPCSLPRPLLGPLKVCWAVEAS